MSPSLPPNGQPIPLCIFVAVSADDSQEGLQEGDGPAGCARAQMAIGLDWIGLGWVM